MSLEPGAKIDRFTVQSVLGEGGMGTVYAVTDPTRSGLPLALKVLRDDLAASETALQRFRREAEAMQHLRQRGLVWLQDYRLEPPTPWLLMERIRGVPVPGGKRAVTLEDLLKAWGGALPEPVVASILDICLQGLAAIHSQGLVHRDIKPGNILLDTSVDPYNDPDRALQYLEPKLGDLGLAGLAQSDGLADRSLGAERTMQPELTMRQGRPDARQAALLGTYDYMSPEQKRGEKATPASDVYSLTLVAFRLLTGQAMGMKGVRELRPELAVEWDEFLVRGYAPRPADRYPTATEMRAGLLPVEAALAGNPMAEVPVTEVPRFPVTTPLPRAPGLLRRTALIVLVASAVAGLAGYGWYRREAPKRHEAKRQQVEAERQRVETERQQAEMARQRADAERQRAEAEARQKAKQEAQLKADAARLAGESLRVDIGGGLMMDLVWIPSGTFMMGSAVGEVGRFDNETQHRVTLTQGFWMGKHEVMQEQWEKVMGNHPSLFKNAGTKAPVVLVSWDDCQAFLRKLNEGPGASRGSVASGSDGERAGPDHFFRLPTEAEWEYACRAGTTTQFGPGDAESDLDRAGWYLANSGNTIHTAGEKQANAWRLHDMHGNVWEWCQDWFGNDCGSEAATDPTGPPSGYQGYRVARGGSWACDPAYCRSATRFGRMPSGGKDTGFRVVYCRRR